MPWALILQLIMTLLPIILEWLKKLLNRTAKALPAPESFASPEAATTALFDAALDATPKRRFGRRILLRVLKRLAVARAPEVFAKAKDATVEIPPFTADETAELADAVGAGK